MQLIPAEFHGTPLSIIDRDGQKWLTSEEVGRCLGYAEANARKGISKLYNAHADEFTDADKGVAELATPGGKQSVTIFSSTGCIKLGFFANTPRAKEFRAWASEALAGKSGAVVVAAPQPDPAALQLATELGLMRDELRLQSAAMLGLYRELDRARRGHIQALTKLTNERQRQAAADAKATVIRMLAEGYSHADIAAATGKTRNHIRQIAFKARATGDLPPAPPHPADTTGDLFEGGAA
ncbi:BRO family protein [Zoogloea sp. 1C4]|uniref:BRO family protein n=1 Tax=Zoogloea sp. 1C4 TaxID=2570190 RepID=UPI0012912D52|nr:BRO family protein [Zoogloea sp. 1C4]